MIYFSGILRPKYSKYANIDDKISRDIKNGKYIKIVKGLYEDDKNTPGYLLAGSIYGYNFDKPSFKKMFENINNKKILLMS